MVKRIRSPFFAWVLKGVASPLLGVVCCLGAASHAPAESPATDDAQVVLAAKEESVLVATRETAADGTTTKAAYTDTTAAETGGEKLEPISQSSDHTPDLAVATDQDDASTHFDDVLVKAAAPTSDGEATRVENPEPHDVPEPEAAVSGGSARRAAAARAQAAPFEPVKFQGVCVGKTSKHELITAWGQPVESTTSEEGAVLVYKKSPFKAVEALIGGNDLVSSIKVTLAAPLESKQLAEQLGLNKLDPLAVTDNTEATVGQAFPERGVLFVLEQVSSVTPVGSESPVVDAKRVSQVVLQPIDAQAFAYRAENRLSGSYAQNIADLKNAIALDPEFAQAYWQLAKIYLSTGQADLADAAIAEACDIEPENASYKLYRAQVRALLGEYDQAVLDVRAVLDREDLAPIDRATALHQMGQLAALGDREIASQAISFETRAIETADKLATSSDAQERRAAKQLLIEAHLAIAEEVARQPYNKKVESLSEWVGRASGLAEDYIQNDKGDIELRLNIAQRVLGSLASFKPTLDPAPWVAEAEEAAKILLAQSSDELWQQQIKWELGLAYLHALRVEHTRRETDAALKYGQLAIDNMAVGASSRQAVHSSEQVVGQLYFQMGAVYAVHKLDHAKAVQWYDKAAPLLTTKRPDSEFLAPRREGEMLVSMGVSYWQMGNQTKALELTQTGVGLVETAVNGGVLDKGTLAVPYGNLANMYEQMGENTNAAKYAALAKSVTAGEPSPAKAKSTPSAPTTSRRPMSQTRRMRTR